MRGPNEIHSARVALFVPRRRVPVELRLTDGATLSGEAYLAIRDGDAPEQLADRLNDAAERFLPIAVGERHVLVRKASIVAAFTADTGAEPGANALEVEMTVTVGAPVRGNLPAGDDSTQHRALDRLNALGDGFVPVHSAKRLALVNTRHVVAVQELRS